MNSGGELAYRRLRAPAEHGQRLLVPAPDEALRQAFPSRCRRQHSYDWQGRPWLELVESARADLLGAAQQYLPSSRSSIQHSADVPLILTGHQPELYHPGVWYKHFVTAELARRAGGIGVHLLIDNDQLGSAAIRVPTGSPNQPELRTVSYDAEGPAVPFEERRVLDPSCLHTFAERVAETMPHTIRHPLVCDAWPAVLRAAEEGRLLGEALAAGRRAIERSWGIENLEVPLSSVCQGDAFRWFLVHLLAEMPRLRQIYNRSLLEYRQVHRLRSRTHPVPALRNEDGWMECPFWIWTADTPQRRALFTRPIGTALELSDRQGLQIKLPLKSGRNGAAAVEVLRAATSIKLRPRALMTTMFARLFLSDLFVHGIGGGKYDQLTDLIIHRFLGIPPAPFLVATATAQLPLPRPTVSEDDLRQAQQTLRALQYHPEKFLATDDHAGRALADEKVSWIARQPPRGAGRQRHEAITRLNKALQSRLGDQRDQLETQLDALRSELREARLLGARDYSWVLFPEKTLQAFLLDI